MDFHAVPWLAYHSGLAHGMVGKSRVPQAIDRTSLKIR